MLSEYRIIIKSQALWIILITLIGFCFAYLAGYVGGENSQLKIRIERNDIIIPVAQVVDSNQAHLQQLEAEWGFNARVRKGKQ